VWQGHCLRWAKQACGVMPDAIRYGRGADDAICGGCSVGAYEEGTVAWIVHRQVSDGGTATYALVSGALFTDRDRFRGKIHRDHPILNEVSIPALCDVRTRDLGKQRGYSEVIFGKQDVLDGRADLVVDVDAAIVGVPPTLCTSQALCGQRNNTAEFEAPRALEGCLDLGDLLRSNVAIDVFKVGRATGYTTGVVLGAKEISSLFVCPPCSMHDEWSARNQILVWSDDRHNLFCKPGDLGALVVATDGRAVGMITAILDLDRFRGTIAVVTPITAVLKSVGASLLPDHPSS